jgi:oligopeptide/dipeptide ABC transporter ATP-binding protein
VSAPVLTPAAPQREAVPLLEVDGLSVAFPTARGLALAVNEVGFSIERGRTLGLVGESGSGKSVSLRALLGLVPPPGGVIGGSVTWRGRELLGLDEHALGEVRGREIGMIFQDPVASLNPVYSVGDQVAEMLRVRRGRTRAQARRDAVELLDRVGIPSPAQRVRDYPHQLSGGMRQRVMIAIALASGPSLLLADEPTTALDVTVQDQILALLVDLQAETDMAMIVVSHDLGVIAQTADRIGVMYAGSMVELGSREEVLFASRHPYTRALLAAAPTVERGTGVRAAIEGQPPAIDDLPAGCPFRLRCPGARDACAAVDMRLIEVAPGHATACPFDAELPGSAG